ncbi:MAG: hypothetical protein AAF462_10530 [Thermodesulfobacteriota bacterium]
MKTVFSILVAALLVISFSAQAFAEVEEMVEMQKGPKGIKLVDAVVMTATVQALNLNERLIILGDDAGNVQVVEAGPEVKNFDQIELGDQVVIEFFESVALFLGSPADKPGESETQIMHTAAEGDKPGMIAVDVIEVIATVVEIDKENMKVKLKGPDGNVVTVKVDPAMGNLENIKVGDNIHARYTEALAVSVQRP